MIMPKILFLIIIPIIFSKNVVIIGDSRACGFAYDILGIPYTYHNAVYGTGSYIISEKAKSFGGHSIKVIAEVGASSYTFTNSAKKVYNGVHTTLRSSSQGTVVLLWLGVNNLDSGHHFNYYKSLAQQYTKLQFYGVSVTGVSSKADVTNRDIKSFNSNLQTKIKNSAISNLKYKSIVTDNVCQIYNSSNGKVTFTVTESTTDSYGVHYTSKGDRECLLAMLAKI